jgi:uncharacterized protein (DUF1800 family)
MYETRDSRADLNQEEEASPFPPAQEASPAPTPWGAGGSTLIGAVALAGCGGGEGETPTAMLAPQNATPLPLLDSGTQQSGGFRSVQRAARTPTPDELMDWAERAFPHLFDHPATSQSDSGLVYRYYPGTGNYLGVYQNTVMVLGPGTGGLVANVGPISSFAEAVFSTDLPDTDEAAARFLLHAQLSASTDEIAQVRRVGFSTWLNSQFHVATGISGWDWLNARGYASVSSTTAYYDNTYPGDYMVWYQLMASPDGVRKRVALALSEILVVSLSGLDISWRSHAIAHYWDLLVRNAFGNYRQLLQDVTLNAAMGYYLNTRGNQKENANTGRQPDENFAREVLQLMSIGLVDLNPDGTPKRDASGNPIDSYSQSDITNLARVFTGYDFDQSQNAPVSVPGTSRTVPSTHYARLPMALNESRHSTLAATFLGASIGAGTSGGAALQVALDTIFNHPNVGPFIGRQLIQRLVTSNPTPQYVARVAAAFNNNGAGVRGDMPAVIRAILLDDEARSPAGLTAPQFGKLREPMLRFVQWGRTFGVRSAQGSWKIGNLSDSANRLGQSPLRSPSVFNFFRPGYVPPSTVLAAFGAAAPEFQLVNESSVGGYLNYIQGVIRNGIYVNAPELPHNASTTLNGYDITPNYANELALIGNPEALVARINLLMCAGQLSPDTVRLIVEALKATNIAAGSSDSAKLNRVAAAIFLTMASPEYLVQK